MSEHEIISISNPIAYDLKTGSNEGDDMVDEILLKKLQRPPQQLKAVYEEDFLTERKNCVKS